MAYYVMLTKLTEDGRKSVRRNPNRIKEVNQEVEEMNAKVISQYALLGLYDFVTVLEAPDNWNMARVAMDLGSRGTVETLTMPALDVESFINFLQMK